MYMYIYIYDCTSQWNCTPRQWFTMFGEILGANLALFPDHQVVMTLQSTVSRLVWGFSASSIVCMQINTGPG